MTFRRGCQKNITFAITRRIRLFLQWHISYQDCPNKGWVCRQRLWWRPHHQQVNPLIVHLCNFRSARTSYTTFDWSVRPSTRISSPPCFNSFDFYKFGVYQCLGKWLTNEVVILMIWLWHIRMVQSQKPNWGLWGTSTTCDCVSWFVKFECNIQNCIRIFFPILGIFLGVGWFPR